MSSTTYLTTVITGFSVYQERQKILQSNYSEVGLRFLRSSIIILSKLREHDT